MTQVIYGLIDPATNEIRYVGYTSKDVNRRLFEHIDESKHKVTSHKHKWIAKLIKSGSKPEIKILETVNDENWQDREKYWIDKLGYRLTNSTEGGEGLLNPSLDVRNRISEKVTKSLIGNSRRKGIPHSEETKRNISEGLLNSERFKAANKLKIGIAPIWATEVAILVTKGVPKSEEHKNKISLGNIGYQKRLGHKASEETKVKMSVKLIGNQRALGHTHSDIVKSKMSKARIGSKWINNGFETKKLSAGLELPTGWNFGMMKFRRKS